MRCQTVAVSALPPVLTRPRRPPVLDAARTALIPLRPLTIGEILDGGFLIVRRNIRLMIGLPLVVAGGTAAYVLAGVGLWVLLGNTTSRSAQIVLVVLMGLLGLLVLQQFLVWLTAILSRVSLQTVLGEGFAPATTRATWRASLPMFWPVLGLSLLQGVAASVVQTIITFLYYAVGLGVVLAGIDDENLAVVGLILVTVVTYALAVVLYGYLSLTVPALATESKNAPGWIGKPARPTNPVTAFERSVRLIGLRNLVRVGLIYGGLVLVCLAVITLVGGGAGRDDRAVCRRGQRRCRDRAQRRVDDLRCGRLLGAAGDVRAAGLCRRGADLGVPGPSDAARGPGPGHAVRLRTHPPALRSSPAGLRPPRSDSSGRPAAGAVNSGGTPEPPGHRREPDSAAAGGSGSDRAGRGTAPGRRGARQGEVRRHPRMAGRAG